MLRRKLISILEKSPQIKQFSSTAKPVEEEKSKKWTRKVVPFVLFSVTGGVALSAIDDLAIYSVCSSKALEKAKRNPAIVDVLGEPILRGPWYKAALSVSRKRHSASCSFPVYGPKGTGVFQLKAVRLGDDSLLSRFRYRDWEILAMEALPVSAHEEMKNKTHRIDLSEIIISPAHEELTETKPKVGGTSKS